MTTYLDFVGVRIRLLAADVDGTDVTLSPDEVNTLLTTLEDAS